VCVCAIITGYQKYVGEYSNNKGMRINVFNNGTLEHEMENGQKAICPYVLAAVDEIVYTFQQTVFRGKVDPSANAHPLVIQWNDGQRWLLCSSTSPSDIITEIPSNADLTETKTTEAVCDTLSCVPKNETPCENTVLSHSNVENIPTITCDEHTNGNAKGVNAGPSIDTCASPCASPCAGMMPQVKNSVNINTNANIIADTFCTTPSQNRVNSERKTQLQSHSDNRQAMESSPCQSPSLTAHSQCAVFQDIEKEMNDMEPQKRNESENSCSFQITTHNCTINIENTDHFDFHSEKERELSWSRSNSEWLMIPLPPNCAY
ncbi:hypothetical protein RFI_20367, partial [Reticulomyxa filosa]